MGTYTFVHRLFQIVRNLERPPKPERHAGADSWVQLYPRKWKQTTSGSKQQQALENEPHIYFWVQRVLVLPPGPKQWKSRKGGGPRRGCHSRLCVVSRESPNLSGSVGTPGCSRCVVLLGAAVSLCSFVVIVLLAFLSRGCVGSS